MDSELTFLHRNIAPVRIPEKNILHVIEPNNVSIEALSPDLLIRECLRNPIGTKRLGDLLGKGSRVLFLVDDYTRMTPTDRILPVMVNEVLSVGIKKEDVAILVASGTHRAMTDFEKIKKYGQWIVSNIRVHDHVWYDASHLKSIGRTENGTEIVINAMLEEYDFIVGVGHIVPHRVAGYSGGAKIIQPGVCGAVTTGQTHWLSAKGFRGKDILGKIDNPVRREINKVGLKAGLKFIFNTVQAKNGQIYKCVCGDPVKAYETGCRWANDVFGCNIDSLADIVISDSYPAHVNMWQSSKGVYSADLALKDDGVLILVTPCPEGIADEHPEVGELGYSNPDSIERLVDSGEFKDLTVAAHILHVGRVITGERRAILVSPGVDRRSAERLGFEKAESVQDALSIAFSLKGRNASLSILKHAGEVMPLLSC